MTFYGTDRLSYIHVEVTTRCNAACPMCLRNRSGDAINPNLKNVYFDVSWFDRFDMQIDKLTLCGNYGDPSVHPKLHDIVERWLERFGTPIIMMTNGGARNPEWWSRLARIAGGKLTVVFGIDGLEDTNHLYRRNVSWNKLMENSQSYINAGGTAGWKFITFKHNQHQINQAREMSKAQGFSFFEQIITNRFRGDKFDVLDARGHVMYQLETPRIDESEFVAKNPNRISRDTQWSGDISCYAKKERSIYVAADGRVYPCCNLGYHYNTDRIEPYASYTSLDDIEPPPNIEHTNLSEIVSNGFFNEVASRWNERPLSRCIRTCGVFRDNLSRKWP